MVLLGDIDSNRAASGKAALSGVVRAIFEALDEADILGPRGLTLHEAACLFDGSEADDERRSHLCAELLIRSLLPDALLAFDGEWLKPDADAARTLKGPALAEGMTALYERVRALAAVTRLREDLERGYSNANAAEARLQRSVWGGIAYGLLAGCRGFASEPVAVPAAEIVRLLVSARLYDLVDAEDLSASSENAFVPWSAPPAPQLSIAASRFAPFAEQQEQQLQKFTALMTDALVK